VVTFNVFWSVNDFGSLEDERPKPMPTVLSLLRPTRPADRVNRLRRYLAEVAIGDTAGAVLRVRKGSTAVAFAVECEWLGRVDGDPAGQDRSFTEQCPNGEDSSRWPIAIKPRASTEAVLGASWLSCR
jgi:hypothetical protein